jgi:hypothetical protein
MPNGDPGYPDEPPELEITAVALDNYPLGFDLAAILEDCNGLESLEQECYEWLGRQADDESEPEYYSEEGVSGYSEGPMHYTKDSDE